MDNKDVELARAFLARREKAKRHKLASHEAILKVRDNHLQEYRLIRGSIRDRMFNSISVLVEIQLSGLDVGHIRTYAGLEELRRSRDRGKREFGKQR